jgi:mannose-6-phosphate isomerase-like protein (cupin superfamily)
LRDFCYGLVEYTTLLNVHHDDLITQLRWIDASEACRQKAERLQAAITRHNIAVELDTFVESWEECSTTHVHDADRLLIIESGEMSFWNCFGDLHRLRPGDKLFIPKHRLHGSVVQSGQCVYHQPVITAEINQKYG